jgi:hypothetical protein
MTIVDYRVLKSLTSDKLETQVNDLIAKGWQPQGGVSLSSTGDWYCQAMVKHEQLPPGINYFPGYTPPQPNDF